MSDLSAQQARELLTEVISRGAPAQADFARELQGRWALSGMDTLPAEIAEQVDLLAQAHLHDPYLTRREPDRIQPSGPST